MIHNVRLYSNHVFQKITCHLATSSLSAVSRLSSHISVSRPRCWPRYFLGGFGQQLDGISDLRDGESFASVYRVAAASVVPTVAIVVFSLQT